MCHYLLCLNAKVDTYPLNRNLIFLIRLIQNVNKLLTYKKQISTELFKNIAINFLDSEFLQSRDRFAVFAQKNTRRTHKESTRVKI